MEDCLIVWINEKMMTTQLKFGWMVFQVIKRSKLLYLILFWGEHKGIDLSEEFDNPKKQ